MVEMANKANFLIDLGDKAEELHDQMENMEKLEKNSRLVNL